LPFTSLNPQRTYQISFLLDNGAIDNGASDSVIFLDNSGTQVLQFRFVGGSSFYEICDNRNSYNTLSWYRRRKRKCL